MLSKPSLRFSISCDPCRSTNFYLNTWFIKRTSLACVQYESCTAANVIYFYAHSIAVSIICVESMECTKLGGKADEFFCLFIGCSSGVLTAVIVWRIVFITWVAVDDRYGCTHGSPSGLIHLTGSPVAAITLALLANHCLIKLASAKRSPMHLIVN